MDVTGRKAEVLAFLVERIVRTGISPTLDEIGVGLVPRVSKERVRELVRKLERDGLVVRTPASVRNLVVPDLTAARRWLLDEYRRAGGRVNDDVAGGPTPFPNDHLPLLVKLEHIPDIEAAE